MYNKRYRTGKGTSLKKRTYAQYKSAKKGNDSLSFIINSNEVFSANYDPATQGGTAAINMWEVLCRNSNFVNLKNMYDQVRIDGVRVRLSVTDAQTSVNEIGKIKNSTVICAWDKTGLSPNQVILFDDNNHEILYDEYDLRAVHSWKTKIGSGIVNATTQKKSTLNSFQRWNCFMSIYPTLNQEKSQYINTADIREFNKRTNYNTNRTDLTDSYNAQCFNDICAVSNPVVPFESSVVKFKPVLLVSVFSNEMNAATGLVTQYGSMSNVIFNGEFSISVTFKNLKPSSEEYHIADGGNRVVVKMEETMLDNSMNVTDENEDGYNSVIIDDFTRNPLVTYNQYNKNYCTSLSIELPSGKEVTPIQLKSVGLTEIQQPHATPAVLKPFATFTDWDPSEHSGATDGIKMLPGDTCVISTPNSGGDEQLISLQNPDDNGTRPKLLKLLNNAKYTVIKATEFVGEVGTFALKVYDVYNKLTMGIPKLMLPMIAAGVETETIDGVTYQVIDGETPDAEGGLILDQENAVLLPPEVYDVLFYNNGN